MTKDYPGKIRYKSTFLYYVAGVWRSILLPRFIRRWQKDLCLKNWERRQDADIIKRRVNYYNKLSCTLTPTQEAKESRHIRLRDSHSRYWFDLMRYVRAFPSRMKLAFINGDTRENPPYPVFCKARRLDSKAANGILLNMDSLRHFTIVDDRIPFNEKEGKLFFRGDIKDKPNRIKFFEMWAGHPDFDLGDTTPNSSSLRAAPRVTIPSHFRYKYILALEGHDVATAVQWICDSNCIPVMTRPTVESWLMHGAMKPGTHYIEIKPDFSDVAEKIDYYNSHPEEALKIAEASKHWMKQFSDPRRENIISYLVIEKYRAALEK